MSTRRALHLRTATAADRDAVCALLAGAQPGGDTAGGQTTPALVDPAAHDWLYWDNPYGQPHNAVWEDDGRIVAHAGLYPGLGVVEGRTIRIGRIAHVATARSHRGQGLYGSLVRRLRDDAAGDLDLIVALPAPAAVPGLEGAGVMRRDRAQRWFRPIGEELTDLRGVPRQLASMLTRVAFGPPPDPDGEPLADLPADLDQLAHDAGSAIGVDGVLADQGWWRWRFVDHPVHDYALFRATDGHRTTAMLACRPSTPGDGAFLQVLHWQALDPTAAAGVLGAALVANPSCVAATLLATDDSVPAEWARRCGMRRLPSLLDDTSGHIALAGPTGTAPVVPGRHWSISLASHHDR